MTPSERLDPSRNPADFFVRVGYTLNDNFATMYITFNYFDTIVIYTCIHE